MGITDRCVEKKQMSLNPELISRTALMEDFRNTITESSETMDLLDRFKSYTNDDKQKIVMLLGIEK